MMTRVHLGSATRRAAWGWLASAALAAGLAATPASSEPSRPDAPAYVFDIPGQPIDTALHAYSTATGVEVLYESSLANDRRSSAVKGRMTAHDALVALIGDPEVLVRYTRSTAITLALRSSETAGEASREPELSLDQLDVLGGAAEPDPSLLQLYGQSVQADVEGRLRRDGRTRSGSYRAEIALWIDPSRTVTRAALARTTGDLARDAAIVEALNGLVVARTAPPQALQPIRLRVTVRAL